MSITHRHQGSLRRIQLIILAAFVITLVTVAATGPRSSPPTTSQQVTQVVSAYVGHAGYARDLYTVQVTTSAPWPTWALFWERATAKGDATFQNTYGVAERVKGRWKMIEWGTALVGCRPGSQKPPIPALAMKALGMPCPPGWD